MSNNLNIQSEIFKLLNSEYPSFNRNTDISKYLVPTINGTTINLNKVANSNVIYVKLNNNINGNIRINIVGNSNSTVNNKVYNINGLEVSRLNSGYYDILIGNGYFVVLNKNSMTSSELSNFNLVDEVINEIRNTNSTIVSEGNFTGILKDSITIDKLSPDLRKKINTGLTDGAISTINGITPDENGNVTIPLISDEFIEHNLNETNQLHISSVVEIPENLDGLGFLVKQEGSESSVPTPDLLDELAMDVNKINDKLDSYDKKLNKVSSTTKLMYSSVTINSTLSNDEVELTSNSNYNMFGLATNSNYGKKFAVAYRIENVGNGNVSRWGWKISYNSNFSQGIAVSDSENVIPGSINIGNYVEGYFWFKHLNDRPYLSPVMFFNGNGVKLKIKQLIYDVTNLTDEVLNEFNYTSIQEYVVSTVEFSTLSAKTINRNSNWQGKTWLTLGDSATASGTYQSIIKSQLGFGNIINKGVVGANVNIFTDNTTIAEIQSSDLITLYGCLNNFSVGNYPVGNLNDLPNKNSTTSFTARLKYTIEYVLNANPNATFVIIGTHNGSGGTLPSELGGIVTSTYTIKDYIKRMEDVAELYALPFINLFKESGINKISQPILTTDGRHLSQVGYEKISRIICGELQRLEPLQ